MKNIVTIALLAFPLAAAAQMKCPDGSYQTRCPGGDGQEVGGSVSTYNAPEQPTWRRPDPAPSSGGGSGGGQASRRAPSGGEGPPPSGPSSLSDRARDMGVSRGDLLSAINRDKILMRMHKRDVLKILGSPDVTNREAIGGQRCEHLHWKEGYRWTHYIRLCNGRVDVIRHNDV